MSDQEDPSGAADFEAELAALADSALFHRASRDAVASGTAIGDLIDVAFARAAGMAEAAETRAKAREVTACRKGCAWCCHQNVRISAAEVFYLARWLRRHLAADALRALADHAQQSAARLNGMPQPQRARARIPCALLDPATGACRVHEARPMLCRGQLSRSAETCRQAVVSPAESCFEPLLDAIHGAGLASMSLELEFSFTGAGAVSGELTAMLAVALTDPAAEERWRGGENPFPPHDEFSTHLNSRLARMLAAAWVQLARKHNGATGDELRAAAFALLRRMTGSDAAAR